MAEHQDHADKHTSDNMSTTGPGEIAPPARRITSTRDKAKMTYLPPDLDVEALIAITPNFNAIPRLNALQLEGDDQFKNLEEFIDKHVVQGGMPLVIENWHKRSDWPWHLFDPRWLTSNHGTDRGYSPFCFKL